MKRFASFRGDSSADADLDDMLGNLYPAELSTLEQKCDISLKENKFLQALRAPAAEQSLSYSAALMVQQFEKSADEVVDQLPPEYFIKDFDPVLGHLEDISAWEDADITQRFMQKIEDTDTDKDVIVGHLTTMIDNNYDELMSCMTKIQDVDVQLIHAGLQISYGRKKIKAASTCLSNGPLKIVSCAAKKERLDHILGTIRGLKALKDVHKAMTVKINTGDLGDAAELARSLLESLMEQSFDQFVAMRNIGNSMQKSIFAIRRKADKMLKRICSRKFTSLEYESIVKAYLLLDNIEQTFKIKNVDPGYEGDTFYFDSLGCTEGLAQRINRFQLEDIDTCLHTAMMDFIVQRKSNSVEILDVSEMPLNMLLRRLSSEQVPLCIIRSCELLADIVHTHYLITQWHLLPFDERNHLIAFLHRSSVVLYDRKFNDSADDGETDHAVDKSSFSVEEEEDEDEEEVDLFNSETSGVTTKSSGQSQSQSTRPSYEDSNNNSSNLARSASNNKLSDVKLLIAYQHITQSRGILWEELLRALINILRATNFISEVKLDDFISMTWALRLLTLLGREFAGSESRALLLCMKDKSEEYVRNFHMETFQVLRTMLDAEIWQNVPIRIEKGGILTSIRSVYATRLALHSHNNGSSINSSCRTVDEEGGQPQSLLQSFAKFGNPFKFILPITHGISHSDDNNDADSSESSSPDKQQKEPPAMLLEFLLQSTGVWSSVDSSSSAGENCSTATKKASEQSSYLITQTSFNGLAKSLAKYIHFMSLIPSSATEIFDQLCQLFDYYCCAAFYSFVPVEERSRFLSSSSSSVNKMLSSAPDHSRDFEILQSHLERSFNDIVYVPRGTSGAGTDATVVSAMDSNSNHNSNIDLSDHNSNGSTSSPLSSSGHGPSGSNSNHFFPSSSNSGHSNVNTEAVKVSSLLQVPQAIAEADDQLCFALIERIVAAESCWFVAQMLVESKPLLLKLLPATDNGKCENYISNYSLVMGQLRSLLYKVTAPLLVNHNQMVVTVAECPWDSRRLREDHHEWVDRLVDSCQKVPYFMF